MGYYRIRSITNGLPKRDINRDRILKIEYNVGFTKKQHNLSSGGEMLISCTNLPTQLQSLRIKKLITISEISENEFIKAQKPRALKTTEIKKPVEVKQINKSDENNKKSSKKSSKKIEEITSEEKE